MPRTLVPRRVAPLFFGFETILGLWTSPTSVASKRNGPDLKTVGATAPRWLVIIGGTGSGHPAAR
jgi:hypothetical protein